MLDINVPVNPFRSKLTLNQRCFMFAAHHHKHMQLAVLAKAFNVNPQTVSKLAHATTTGRYKDIYAISRQLGVERMWDQYATPELVKLVEESVHKQTVQMLVVQDHYQASGPGAYWLKDSHRNTRPVEIESFENIDPDQCPLDQTGFYFRPQGDEFWKHNEAFDRSFKSVEEALRYLAEYPELLNA